MMMMNGSILMRNGWQTKGLVLLGAGPLPLQETGEAVTFEEYDEFLYQKPPKGRRLVIQTTTTIRPFHNNHHSSNNHHNVTPTEKLEDQLEHLDEILDEFGIQLPEEEEPPKLLEPHPEVVLETKASSESNNNTKKKRKKKKKTHSDTTQPKSTTTTTTTKKPLTAAQLAKQELAKSKNKK